jgi:hypothetical protein
MLIATFILGILFRGALAAILILRLVHRCCFLPALKYGTLNPLIHACANS